MKYLSLIEVMRLYGSYIQQRRRLIDFSYASVCMTFNSHFDYKPFIIESIEKNESGQSLNRLDFNHNNPYDHPEVKYGNIPEFVIMPPILEIEWLKKEINLDETIADILTQIGYMYMASIMGWAPYDLDDSKPEAWMNYLLEHEVIKEIEELDDTPIILSNDPLPESVQLKIRSWNNILAYGSNFPEVFKCCENQTNTFKMIYLHAPIIMAMFMIECHANKLSNWTKDEKLNMEKSINDLVNSYYRYTVDQHELYTYGTCSVITQIDRDLIIFILNLIYDELHEINADIGLITYGIYRNIRGPKTIRADVCLTNMFINWDIEIERVEHEKDEQKTDSEYLNELFDEE